MQENEILTLFTSLYGFAEKAVIVLLLHFSHYATVLYLEMSVVLEFIPNSVNPKDPISVKTL